MLNIRKKEFEQTKEKLCTGINGCNTIKSVKDFSKRGPCSYNTICKECFAQYKKARRKKDIEV
jgi:hypothetical protein